MQCLEDTDGQVAHLLKFIGSKIGGALRNDVLLPVVLDLRRVEEIFLGPPSSLNDITPRTSGSRLPMTPTVTSRPGRNSSMRMLDPGYAASSAPTWLRNSSSHVTRELSLMPMLEPSRDGLTNSGYLRTPDWMMASI